MSNGTGGFGSAVKKEELPAPETSKTPFVKVEDSSNTQVSLLGGGMNVFGETFGSAQVKEESRTESIKTEPSASTLSPPPMAPKSSSAMSNSESISTGRVAKSSASSPEESSRGSERKLDRIDELTRMSPELKTRMARLRRDQLRTSQVYSERRRHQLHLLLHRSARPV